eukprot:3938181-Rhodomonas_salina.2
MYGPNKVRSGHPAAFACLAAMTRTLREGSPELVPVHGGREAAAETLRKETQGVRGTDSDAD